MAGPLTGRTLLGVFAHPDDESLACGGLLAICADEGMRVVLLCATPGEGGPDAQQPAGTASLAERRARELSAAADVLGVHSVTLLDFEDGMLPWVDGDGLEDAIGAVIARWSPDAVVTFDEDGLYWHPDHIAVHHATTAAVARAGPDSPALYYVSLPGGRMRALVDAVRGRMAPGASMAVLGVDDPDAFGSLAPAPDLAVDVRRAAGRKLAALRCHHTQSDGGPLSVVTEDEAVQLLGVEHIRRAPVGDTWTPMLELLNVED